ncbi:uncharacterized protein LOC135487229 [Lineus longissimus]|uniref:uncharacterized protein LOC135487229 n=1 Tax=Lineus longissimus TaxID=88925 RepID=UPI00315DF6A3
MPFLRLRFAIFSLTISVFHIFPQGTVEACFGKNWALNKPTGTYPRDTAMLQNQAIPVNGKRDNPEHTCAEISTQISAPGSWFVDLGKSIPIRTIIMTYRGRNNEPVGFEVRLFDTSPGQYVSGYTCLTRDPSILSNPYIVEIVYCSGNDYRYVSVTTTSGEHVLLCQVEVYEFDIRIGHFSPTTLPLTVQQYQVLTTRSRIECATMCLKTTTCVGFNYKTQAKECDLFDHAASTSAVLPTFTLDCRITDD